MQPKRFNVIEFRGLKKKNRRGDKFYFSWKAKIMKVLRTKLPTYFWSLFILFKLTIVSTEQTVKLYLERA